MDSNGAPPPSARPGTIVRKVGRAVTASPVALARVGVAAWWLLAVRAGLRLLPYLRLRALLAWGLPPTTEAYDPAVARRSAWAVEVAARNTWPLPEAHCLPRALVLERLLRARGFPAEIRIGVRPAGASGVGGGITPGIDAHAWVECCGDVLGDSDDVSERFTTLRRAAKFREAPPSSRGDQS